MLQSTDFYDINLQMFLTQIKINVELNQNKEGYQGSEACRERAVLLLSQNANDSASTGIE